MTTLSKEINIRHFTDFRSFLRNYVEESKSKNPRWTWGVWAKQLGLADRSSISKVVQGSAEPGDKLVKKMSTFFQFNENDSHYFEDLIRLNKLQNDPKLSLMLLEKMGKIEPDLTEQEMDEQNFTTIANWYYLPLRESVNLKNFKEDPEILAKKFIFPVNADEISSAIETMLRLGLLKRDEKGHLKPATGRVNTGNKGMAPAVRQYHRSMLTNAQSALETIATADRHFCGSTIRFNQSNMSKASELIEDFKKKFVELFEEKEGDTVVQMQMQLFPVIRE
jgi:uncharacterized protein (TIGR02147 family)